MKKQTKADIYVMAKAKSDSAYANAAMAAILAWTTAAFISAQVMAKAVRAVKKLKNKKMRGV